MQSNKVDILKSKDYSKKTLTPKLTQTVVSNAIRMLRINPARAISEMVTQPLPKTIALGGVATGNINANEADKVAGIISING